jgi:hypothetical protein
VISALEEYIDPIIIIIIRRSCPCIIRMIKSRKMRWAGHVVRMGVKRNAYRILIGMPEGKNHWEDQDVGGWTILKWILER